MVDSTIGFMRIISYFHYTTPIDFDDRFKPEKKEASCYPSITRHFNNLVYLPKKKEDKFNEKKFISTIFYQTGKKREATKKVTPLKYFMSIKF